MSEQQQAEPPNLPEDLPAPSAEFVMMRSFVEAYLSTNSRKKGQRFLRAVSESLATEESVAFLLPIRPSSQHAAISKAGAEPWPCSGRSCRC
jgi:hypothetical protein